MVRKDIMTKDHELTRAERALITATKMLYRDDDVVPAAINKLAELTSNQRTDIMELRVIVQQMSAVLLKMVNHRPGEPYGITMQHIKNALIIAGYEDEIR